MSGRVLDIDTARVYQPLLQPARYKAAHGGRGSAKSHFFAELLVDECMCVPGTRAVGLREVQKSLAQSSKRTIEHYIEKHGLTREFDIQRDQIKTPGNGLILFQGMQNHTAESIKSLEGFRIAWTDEAQTLSATSLRLLRPTLRMANSQLWFSWNPRKPEDPVDDFLRGNGKESLALKAAGKWTPPPRSIVVEANWQHNPWFYDTELPADKDYDRQRDVDMYGHVWGGSYVKNSQARVFKRFKVEDFEPPKPGTVLYGGGDFGFSIDPTVGIIVFIVGRTLYIWREVWAIGCEIDHTPALFDKLDPDWSPSNAADPDWKSAARRIPFICDSARPETISYLQRHGYASAQSAIKGTGSVEEGVEFLKQYDIVIHPSCKHVADEFEHYSFKIDPHTGDITNVLEDKKNHTIDSCRYAIENVRRAHSSKKWELRI